MNKEILIPLTELLDRIEMSKDSYFEDGEVENNFYNAALNDLEYWIIKTYKNIDI